MKNIVILIILFNILGCRGSGFNKKLDLMPDEIYLSTGVPFEDINSWNDEKEITIGVKWKLRN